MNTRKLYLLLQCVAVSAKVACLDANGNSVSRWAIFKFPTGSNYAYWDPTTSNILSQSDSLNSTDTGALALTMTQLWDDKSVGYTFYNDEIPNSSGTYNFSVGHSKGVWMWDEQRTTAVFIQHSVPKFPTGGPESLSAFEGLPSNAWDYGQHLLCLSLEFADLQSIVKSYIHIMPQIYEYRGTFDALIPLLNGEYDGDPVCETVQFVTANIQGFAKTSAWNSDLYENCIAPSYNQGLVVESWLHGDSPLGPTCSPYAVVDVATLDFGATSFSNYDDHSKWAIGNHTNFVCFSDINRMESQFARNGAGFCFKDAGLWMSMLGVVSSTDSDC